MLVETAMRVAIAVLVLGVLASRARADVFAFKDLEGFEKCLRTDHLVEKVATQDGEQTRWLSPAEIQLRCIDAAVKLLSGSKDTDQMREFIKATKRESAHVNAIDLVGVLAAASLPGCNEMEGYEVMLAALSMPKDHNIYFTKAKRVVKRCLKDPTFRQDFLEEKDSSNTYLSANACAILLEEKLVKACKAAK